MSIPFLRDQGVRSERITTPFQLLAVLLLGLSPLVWLFINASLQKYVTNWIPKMYAITSVVLVPLFLLFILSMQTIFRDKMLSDEHYLKLRIRELKKQEKEVNKGQSFRIIRIGKK